MIKLREIILISTVRIPNNYIRLDYNPTTDVLIAELPVFGHYIVSEMKFILSQITQAVIHYNVKYLITDSRGKIQDIPDSTYKEVVFGFAQELMTTNLKKIARLADIESSKQDAAEEIKLAIGFPIPIKHFYSKEDCFEWILNEQPVNHS